MKLTLQRNQFAAGRMVNQVIWTNCRYERREDEEQDAYGWYVIERRE